MTPRRIDEVQPGYYRFRRVRGGPWLPAVVSVDDGMIYIVEADERLQVGITAASYADAVVELVAEGKAFESPLWRVLFFGEPIDAAEYQHLLELIAWARENDPDHPLNHPDQPIKLAAVKVSTIF
jgi:hypothetical protein